ncbi:MAG: ComEC/Rec2 family competence protein [Clostridia bacterium]|nr:ComEC/Rec2 family competence protein [Clostridia bacterium]
MEDWLKQHRYFNERPMLWGISGALLGALLALHLGGGTLLLLGLAALALGVLLLLRGKALYALPLFLGLLLLRGAILPYVTVTRGVYTVTGTVIDGPEKGRSKTVATLSRVRLDGQRVPGILELTVPYDADLAYGDELSLQAVVAEDDRGAVRCLSAVLYAGEVAGPIAVRPGRADPLYGLALRWRARLAAAADALFGEDAGPAKGMLFGDRDDVGYLTFLAYRRSGMLHLLTVSGLHVGVVCGAALRLIRGRRRWLRFLLSALVLGLFCLLTGLSPSSIRAAVMLLIVRFARLLDRQDDPISEVGCAWTLLLLIEPAFLMAPGFRLTFGAVWGLACLSPAVIELLHGRQGRVGSLLVGAVAVFLGMMPLLSVSGGQISWVGVFLSVLVLPVAPFFLIPGWLAVLFYPLLPVLGQALALVPRGVLYYLTTLAELVPVEGLVLRPCSGAALLLWFTGMLFVSPYFLPNREKPAYLGWGLMTAGALVWFLV